MLVLLLAFCSFDAPAAGQAVPRTWQEEHGFRQGPTPALPLMDYWRSLAAASPQVSLQTLVLTPRGRELSLVVIADEELNAPDAIRSGKTIVLITNAVHGGETAGKEASQLVARELASGALGPLLQDIIVLIVPMLNPDGGATLRRANSQGLDLNRDYVKLESNEIRSLVGLMNAWTPDIHVDTHHGGSGPYTLTWQGTLNPAVDQEIRSFPYREIFPRIRTALRAKNYDGFDYSGPRRLAGVRGWGSTSVEPRKHHVYTGLVNTIGILLESPPGRHRLRERGSRLEEVPEEERYLHRVRGQVIALREILRVAAERREEIRAVTNGARLRTAEQGQTFDEDDRIVLSYRLATRGREQVWMPSDRPGAAYAAEEVDVFLRWERDKTTVRPLGYVLPANMRNAVSLLTEHGIVVHRFTRRAALELEVYHAIATTKVQRLEGHHLNAVEVERSTEIVQIEPGAYYVSMAQSRGNLIAYLMEPETDENLITWGYADHVLEATGAGPKRLPMMRLTTDQPMTVERLSD